jgi:hypothetical protein
VVDARLSALAQHLARLRLRGLLTTRRTGQSCLFSHAAADAPALLAALNEVYCRGVRKRRA